MPSKWNLPDGTRMVCRIEYCDEPAHTQGMCRIHYNHFYYMSTNGQGRRRNKRIDMEKVYGPFDPGSE